MRSIGSVSYISFLTKLRKAKKISITANLYRLSGQIKRAEAFSIRLWLAQPEQASPCRSLMAQVAQEEAVGGSWTSEGLHASIRIDRVEMLCRYWPTSCHVYSARASSRVPLWPPMQTYGLCKLLPGCKCLVCSYFWTPNDPAQLPDHIADDQHNILRERKQSVI